MIGPLVYLRFNHTTGDAAGQNLTGRDTGSAPRCGVRASTVRNVRHVAASDQRPRDDGDSQGVTELCLLLYRTQGEPGDELVEQEVER